MNYRYLLLTFLFFYGASMAENHVVALNIKKVENQIVLHPRILFKTTPQVKEAIDNGIRIQIIAKAQLVEPRPWWFDKTIDNQKYNLEVSYFTLGKLYIVKNTTTGEQLGFNEYEQLWKEFETLLQFKFNTVEKSNVHAKLRVVLDKGSLPTVMQLPTLFNPNWDIDTPWLQQAIEY